MDKWLQHAAASDDDDPSTGSGNWRRQAEEDFPWKAATVDVDDEELIEQVTGSTLTVYDPLKDVDLGREGLHIWRIKPGALVHWKHEDYGVFYDNDCYIVLHVRILSSQDGRSSWTVHLWIGRRVSEALFRQAVYRTVTLAKILKNEAVVHREVQGHETSTFKAHFSSITYLKGSSDDSYWSELRMRKLHKSRLLKCYCPDARYDHYRFMEVACRENQLNTSFVYILDVGTQLYQWNGELCQSEDILKAVRYLEELKCARGLDIKVSVINDNNNSNDDDQRHPFYTFLSRSTYLSEGVCEEDGPKMLSFPSTVRARGTSARGTLFRLSNTKGRLQFHKTKNGVITMKDVTKEISCLVDLGTICILWFSNKVAPADRAFGLVIVQEYLKDSRHPVTSAVVVAEGQSSKEVKDAFTT